MPVYDYTALDAKGKNITGIIDADSAAAARQRIRSAGNFPVKVKEVQSSSPSADGKKTTSFSALFTRVRPTEIAIMTRQLATLISAGFPLVSALETLMSQIANQGLKKIVAKVKGDVVEGSNFANALGKFPNVFSEIYINMVRAGETSGTLEIVLERLAEVTEKQQELNNRVITAMIYPILIMCTGLLILTFLFIYVIPNITSIFENTKQALPLPTRLLIGTSDLFVAYWWVLVILIVAGLLTFRKLSKTPGGRNWIDQTMLRLPMVGSLVRKMAAARFARTLASLLQNGISMLPSMAIVQSIVGNVHIAKTIENANVEVGKGQGLAKSLEAGNCLPPLAVQMIQVGEQSGDLEEMLSKVADIFEKEVETTVMRMTAMMEPIMVLAMAGVVLFIVLSICLPIFEMRTLIN